MDNQESVDFDFFETPRNVDSSPASPSKQPVGKPPCAPKHERTSADVNIKRNDYYSSDESFTSGSDGEETVDKPVKSRSADVKNREKNIKKSLSDSESESSSAYSNSDYSSDTYEERTPPRKEKIQVNIPKVQAWDIEAENPDEDYEKVQKPKKGERGHGRRSPRDVRSGKRNQDSHYSRNQTSSTDSSESDSSDSDTYEEKGKRKSALKNKHENRNSSAKTRDNKKETRRPLKSASSSHSNNSDITDVSPLESPEASPRGKRRANKKDKHENGGYHVQYEDETYAQEGDPDIKLDSDKIDLSILMKCMADIDKEKQQRLKTNSRRVMFAPPERTKPNYSFTEDRAKMIEKENQRLLKQIMHNITPGHTHPPSTTTRTPKKAVQPVINRMTPSAVNRMREQRRIEFENMHILHRLGSIRPTPGMSRTAQMKEFDKMASYGVPGKTMIVSGDSARYHTMRQQDMHTSLGFSQRSRPSSAKSNASVPGKRTRPSSAKSDVSLGSNASMRSTGSKRSTASVRSNASFMSTDMLRKMSDGRKDKRPEWNDRFTCS